MDERRLKRIIDSKKELEKRINFYIHKRILIKQHPDLNEIKGHIEKSEHNLNFINDVVGNYLDWAITGCYYAVYHGVLALILKKGFISKNHDATLCILIEEYYKKGITKEDIELINEFFLDYQDLLFYVQSRVKREEATYSSNYKFDKTEVRNMQLKTIKFVNKIKELLEE